MILGILLIAMATAAAVSVALALISAPLWLVLLAYPVTGTAVVFAGLAIAEARARGWSADKKRRLLVRVTSRFRAGQRPP